MYTVILRPLNDFCFVVKKSVITENETVDHNSAGGRYEKLGEEMNLPLPPTDYSLIKLTPSPNDWIRVNVSAQF